MDICLSLWSLHVFFLFFFFINFAIQHKQFWLFGLYWNACRKNNSFVYGNIMKTDTEDGKNDTNYSLCSLHKVWSARYLVCKISAFGPLQTGPWSTGLCDLVCKFFPNPVSGLGGVSMLFNPLAGWALGTLCDFPLSLFKPSCWILHWSSRNFYSSFTLCTTICMFSLFQLHFSLSLKFKSQTVSRGKGCFTCVCC